MKKETRGVKSGTKRGPYRGRAEHTVPLSLRVPESLRGRLDAIAAEEKISTNAWCVAAIIRAAARRLK